VTIFILECESLAEQAFEVESDTGQVGKSVECVDFVTADGIGKEKFVMPQQEIMQDAVIDINRNKSFPLINASFVSCTKLLIMIVGRDVLITASATHRPVLNIGIFEIRWHSS
jgi:hypothetical protein